MEIPEPSSISSSGTLWTIVASLISTLALHRVNAWYKTKERTSIESRRDKDELKDNLEKQMETERTRADTAEKARDEWREEKYYTERDNVGQLKVKISELESRLHRADEDLKRLLDENHRCHTDLKHLQMSIDGHRDPSNVDL